MRHLRLKRFSELLTLPALLAALILLPAGPRAALGQPARQDSVGPTVSKVEPPSWWAGHSINPVRLVVRGRNLRGARVSSARPEAQPGEAVSNATGTYLFVNVRIDPAARPGDYPLTLETASGKTLIPFSLDAGLDRATNFQGITSDDVVYLIMTDRFSNGDRANDAPAGSPAEAGDRRNSRAYHGGDLRGVINHLPYLKDLGVTAIWLTPWYDNWNGVQTCDKPWCPNTSYHGYGAIDYYAVEDHFGQMRDLQELVRKAHALGLKVIQDQVANHVGVHHDWTTNPPLDNWYHGTLQRHTQNPFRGDLLLSPHASEAERRPTLDGWFDTSLPDMNQEEPEVARYEIQNALWWIGMTGLDGIREDTIQYMPRPFIRDLLAALHKEYPRMWMVGEVFDRDPVQTSFFMGGRAGWDGIDTGLDSVFDFPLWQTSLDVFAGEQPVRALRDRLKYDVLYPDPNRLTTMLSNHDVRRTISLEKMTPEGAMMHTAFLLSVRGVPQLYYGDEIGMEGREDPDNRRDFPGGFPGDTHSAFEAAGRTPREELMHGWTRAWLRLRREHEALRRGRLIDLAYDDDSYVFARRSERELLLVAVNRAATSKEVVFDAELVGVGDQQVVPLMGASGGSKAVNGKIRLLLPPRMVVPYAVLNVLVR